MTPEQIAEIAKGLTLPEGWKPHDRGPCPVPLDSRPGVMFRDGKVRTGWPASLWAPSGDDWWQHQGEEDVFDIIAYLPEATP